MLKHKTNEEVWLVRKIMYYRGTHIDIKIHSYELKKCCLCGDRVYYCEYSHNDSYDGKHVENAEHQNYVLTCFGTEVCFRCEYRISRREYKQRKVTPNKKLAKHEREFIKDSGDVKVRFEFVSGLTITGPLKRPERRSWKKDIA